MRTRATASTAPTRTTTRRASHRSRSTRSSASCDPRRRDRRPSRRAGRRTAPARRGRRRGPATVASSSTSVGSTAASCSAVVCSWAPRSAQLVGDRLEAVGDQPQVLGRRRSVAGDEPLDALDHAGDAVGEAGESLGRLGELVLGHRAELVDGHLRRGDDAAGVVDAGLGGPGEGDEVARSSSAIGSAASTARAAESAATSSPSRYVVPTRCTEHEPEDHGHDDRDEPDDEQAGRTAETATGRATPSGQPCRARSVASDP